MTTEQKSARWKLSLLELATDLGSVSKACRAIGYSRSPFQRYAGTRSYGAEGLIGGLPGARGPQPKEAETEAKVIGGLSGILCGRPY